MKKFFSFIIFLIIVFEQNSTYAKQIETSEQMELFGIKSFIKNAQNYAGDFFEGTDFSEILNSSLKGKFNNSIFYKNIYKILSKEFKSIIKSTLIILLIIIIHSFLKAISDGFESTNVSNLVFYVQYITIVTIIMGNISDIINLIKNSINNLIGFANLLIPILISLMLYTGSIVTTGVLQPIMLFMVSFIGNFIQNLLIPMLLIIISLIVISKISNNIQIEKIIKFFKSGTIWTLGIILTIFVSVVSLEGNLASSIDGITAKTAKTVVSSSIPVVGKILGDVVDSVLGAGVILKNALGFFGIAIIVGICIKPIIKLALLMLIYKMIAAISEIIADKKIVELLEQISDIFKVLLAILFIISFMIIIGISLLIKISNIGMMYR